MGLGHLGQRLLIRLTPSDLTIYKMILTQCAVCAAPLGLSLGKKCGRCSTRYCGPECQVQHWKEGGHDKLCKKIKKAGGAEQYNANKKYAESVTVAAEACAEDTKGQTCYMCTQAVHWKTKEGLVRMCACRGTAGFAHVSCLAEQAKILVADAEENHSDDSQWHRWHRCGLCEQRFQGVVDCALGWACWKTYVGRLETDAARVLAMEVLGNGLDAADRDEDALVVREAELSTLRRLGLPEYAILNSRANLATTYERMGRRELAQQMKRDVYSGRLKLYGEENDSTIRAAYSHANSLRSLQRFDEAKSLLLKMTPLARRILGENHDITLAMRSSYASALFEDADATLNDIHQAVTTLEETERTARRVFGGAHPLTVGIGNSLRLARAALGARSVCEAMAAMTPPGDA